MLSIICLIKYICIFIILLICNGQKFDPYIDNGGTVLGLCGNSFTIIAADTRLSDGVIIIIINNNIYIYTNQYILLSSRIQECL